MKRKLFAMLLCASMVLACGQAFADAPVKGPADIVFILDTTGSMGPYITAVRNELTKFVDKLGEYNLTPSYAVLEYKDINIDAEKDSVFIVRGSDSKTWSTTKEAFDERLVKSLNNVSGGGDWPETPQPALQMVANWTNTDWNPNSQNARVVFILTDAPSQACTGHSAINTDAALIKALADKKIIVSVIGCMADRDHYKPLFQQSSGVFIDIMTEDWYKSMLDIATYIGEIAETSADERLPYTTVETVDDASTTTAKVAETTGVPAASISTFKEENRPLYDISVPHEISEDLKNNLSQDIEFIAKIDTVILYAEGKTAGTEGYFLFEFEIPDAVANSADIKALTIGNYNPLNTVASYDQGYVSFAMLDPKSAAKLEHIQKNVLALLYGKTEDALVLYLIKDKNDGNKIKLWNSNAKNAGASYSYVTKNREDTKKTLEDAMKDLAKEGKSFADVLKDTWDNTKEAGSYKDRVKSFLQAIWDAARKLLPDDVVDTLESVVKATSGGGCEAGFGLIGVIALAGLAFKKRS